MKDLSSPPSLEYSIPFAHVRIKLIAFNVGYILQDIVKCVYVGLGGTVLTFLVVIPPWPFYKRNPVKWLPAGSAFNTGGT
jgi:signal peptidase complex subunit 1